MLMILFKYNNKVGVILKSNKLQILNKFIYINISYFNNYFKSRTP